MNISIAAKNSLKNVESSICKFKKEDAVFLNEKGATVFEKMGVCDGVYITPLEQLRILERKKRDIMTHNHPLGSPLSIQDIYMAFKLRLKEVRAVTPKKTVNLMELPKKLTPDVIEKGFETSRKLANILNSQIFPISLEKYTKFYRLMRKTFEKEIPGIKFRTLI